MQDGVDMRQAMVSCAFNRQPELRNLVVQDCVGMVQAMVSCAFNGLGLALVIPCVQSLVADYHPSEARGQAFGFMGLTSSFGGPSNPAMCIASQCKLDRKSVV